MKSVPGGLNPAQAVAQRVRLLEADLLRARAHLRRNRNHTGASHWRLDPTVQAQHEEGWFMTYLDVMTLLLVAMLVMLAFSGTLNPQQAIPRVVALTKTDTQAPPFPINKNVLPSQIQIPEPDLPSPYPALADVSLITAVVLQQDGASTQEIIPEPGFPAPYPALFELDSPSAYLELPEPGLPAPYPAQADADLMRTLAPQVSFDSGAQNNHSTEGESLAAALSLEELGHDVEVIVNERSVSFRINSEILFGTGQADLSLSGLSVLQRTAQVLANAGYDITVEGHTDSVPVRSSNARYPSNWELSSARAGSVVRYLQANGIEKTQLKAVGYADTRPIADNGDAQGRMRNRRVELMVEKSGAMENIRRTPDP